MLVSISVAQLQTVPGGVFVMGSAAGEIDEQPERNVELTGFSLTKYEITEKEYEDCVAAGKCTPAHYSDSACRAWNGSAFIRVRVPSRFRHPQFPVVCVTWHQARQYCASHNMSLPSEAQWEYAARAGTTSRFPWGNTPSGSKCVVAKKDGPSRVGSCSANNWGLHDMIGNVWEWVKDYYDPQEYMVGAHDNPSGPEVGLYRCIRGSGWYGKPVSATVTNRQWFSPDYGEVSIGFRCIKENQK